MKTRQVKRYWLRVESDGTEHRLLRELPGRSILVEADGDFERTTTGKGIEEDGPAIHFIHVPGWEIEDNSRDKRTIWRRRTK